MEAVRMLRLGAALSLLAVVVGVANGLLQDQGLDPLLRIVAGLCGILGLLLLILSVYRLAAPPAMPTLLLAGVGLFALGRLARLGLGLALSGAAFRDPAVLLMFSFLEVLVTVGTVLLVVGVFQVVRERLQGAPPAPRPAPLPDAAKAPPPGRVSAIRPPQAPLPPPKPAPSKSPAPK